MVGTAGSPTTHLLSSNLNSWLAIGSTLFLGIGTDTPLSKVDIIATNGYSQLRMRTTYTPSSTTDANGNTGDFAYDSTYLYLKTATGWGRLLLDYVF